MSSRPLSVAGPRHGILVPILVGGLSAGIIDAAFAFYMFGRGMPRHIASGLLGASALHGGAGVWLLGLACHFSIMLIVASLYGLASLELPFLRVNAIVCGIACGIGDFLIMNLIVLPLSADPAPVGPFTVSDLIHGIVVTILTTGLPIAVSFRYLPRPRHVWSADSAAGAKAGSPADFRARGHSS